MISDPAGGALMPFPLPANAAYAGLSLFAQTGWLDPCGPLGVTASRGLEFTIVP